MSPLTSSSTSHSSGTGAASASGNGAAGASVVTGVPCFANVTSPENHHSHTSRLAYLNSAALMSSMHHHQALTAAAAGPAAAMSMFHSFPGAETFARGDVCSGK